MSLELPGKGWGGGGGGGGGQVPSIGDQDYENKNCA